MAHLKTTYIEGDLYVQNSLRVNEYKTINGNILAIVEGTDNDFDGELDEYAGKLVVFKDNTGKIGKSYLRIEDSKTLDDYPDAEGKKFYPLKFDPTGQLQTGLILKDMYSGDIKLYSTPIYLHEGNSPTWNYIFKDSVQDVTYKEQGSYTLIVVAKSKTEEEGAPPKDVIFTGSGLLVDAPKLIDLIKYTGYEISGYSLTCEDSYGVSREKTLSSKNIINSIKVDSEKKNLVDFTIESKTEDSENTTYCLVIPHMDTKGSSVYTVEVILELEPREISITNKAGEFETINISIESTVNFRPESYTICSVLGADNSLTDKTITFEDKEAVRYSLQRENEAKEYEEIASYLPNTTWGLATVFEDKGANYKLEAIFPNNFDS